MFLRSCYTLALFLMAPFVWLHLIWQLFYHKKYQKGFSGRLWKIFSPKKKGMIWMHAVSVGEVSALAPLLEFLPQGKVLISTITETGLKEAVKHVGEENCFFLPLDLPWVMKRLLQQLAPSLLVISEGDLWFWMLRSAKKQGVPIVLVNGKLSKRSFIRYSFVPSWAKQVFSQLTFCCIQTEQYRERFAQFGVQRSLVTGNLKWEKRINPVNHEELRHRYRLTQDPLLIFGSTHDPEEELLLHVIAQLRQTHSIQALLVPRHIERAPQLRQLAIQIDPKTGVVDRMGELTGLYQLATLSFVGGSLFPKVGGHNLLEPLQAGSVLIYGPYVQNQEEMHQAVQSASAGLQVHSEQLLEALIFLLDHPEKRFEMLTRGGVLLQQQVGAVQKTLKVLNSLVTKRKGCL